ncbi:MAG: malto-oligosyltrehalose synthase [Gammaproteobacteria bacterium]
MNNEAGTNELAAAVGLATSYFSIGGERLEVPPESLRVILQGLGYADDNPQETLAALAAERTGMLIPPVTASFEPAPPRITLNPAALAGDGIEWMLTGEGRELAGKCALADLEAGEGQLSLALPALAPGYYRLRIAAGGKKAEALLVRAPEKAWLPETPERGYGFSIQLYEQIGSESIGIGDFSDLAGLGEAAGRMGAATLGINPLHALFLSAPERCSPYSPNSRLALNPLYLDVRRLPGATETMRQRLASPAFAARITALNAQALVDYPAAAQIKLDLAREAHANFRASGGDPECERFIREAEPGATAWARYETIAAVHGANFHDWPQSLQDPHSAACERFVAEHREAHDFYYWLQWQTDAQLGEAARRTREAGLGIGLYHDLALGADPAGAEVWAGGEAFAATLGVGAPPDPLNPRGQNWGFPPLHPRRLVEQGLAPFIELVRTNVRHAGVLRIDHVLGLNRLFVVPPGGSAAEGAYLHYPLDLLLAVVALESQRAHCMVIGEDLGTVPEGLRDKLAARGILSLRLLYFERSETGRPLAPEQYPRDALATVGTHDVVPLPGWWRGKDLERTDRLDLWPEEETREAAQAARPEERATLAEAFTRAGLPEADAEPPTVAAYRWLACSPSRLVSIQPEDALDIEAPVNVPGTLDEEPNWRRRRLPPWPQWLADPRLIETVRAVQTERGAPAPHHAQPPLVATYRLQLHRDFGFHDAAACAPYLARLGASHLYVSPIMSAVPGSTHGYDMTDPARLDAERGGRAGFDRLRHALAREDLGLVVDFVPNHMGAHPANPWWMDLLEWGHASVHDASFDVDWAAEDGRLVVPVLGAPLAEVLEHGDISLDFDPAGRFHARYFAHRFPLAPSTSAILVGFAARRMHSPERAELASLARHLYELDALPTETRRAAGLALEADLAALAERAGIDSALARAAETFAGDARRLARLLDGQTWRLEYWRRGAEDINYRRFFDITDLAALRMERPAVFAAAHAGIRSLVAAGVLAGLRLDHVDGLATPGHYLETLHNLVEVHGSGTPSWVEKILAFDEMLCPWPVAGTTGYEFLNDVTRFFVPAAGADELRELWRECVPDAQPFEATLAAAKRELVEEAFAPMLDRIVIALAPQAPVEAVRLRAALVVVATALPVYRAYPDAPPSARSAQNALVERAVAAVDDVEARAWLATLLVPPVDEVSRLPAQLRDGVTRFWQLTAAAMAKGLEDTAFYRDFSLLALNEVGGDPRIASLSDDDFHARMAQRARDWPAALNASATHDTKRGEDTRLRLAMLAARAGEWRTLVPRLDEAATAVRPEGLHAADEYLIWQTLLAVWPPPADKALDAAEQENLTTRVEEYLVKALREGKARSSWLKPDEAYEHRVCGYAAELLDPERGAGFQRKFLPFAAAVVKSGALASLAALTLKCTAPGVPDIYQGTELWDLSLVDPDNRRPVNYSDRERLLAELDARCADTSETRLPLLNELMDTWPDGRIKLYVLRELLAMRQKFPTMFTGDYTPLPITGARNEDVLAFARGTPQETEALILIARVNPALEEKDTLGLSPSAWGDTRVLADRGVKHWHEIFTRRRFSGDELRVSQLLAPLPVAVLVHAND